MLTAAISIIELYRRVGPALYSWFLNRSPPRKKREAQGKQEVRQDGPDDRSADHVKQTGLERHQSNDQLRGITEGGVQ
jgi:hypothetical protein